jgi:L-amino acid N-acyltransferase YncA
VRLRTATAETIGKDIERIFRVSLASFQKNFLYSPLSQQEFTVQYQKILPYVDPRMVLLAERGDEAVGFSFCIPDILQKQRAGAIDTFILKTIAILPEPSLRGLGSLLVAKSHRIGHELGYRRCIHALMHENNTSLNISRHYATPIRRYTLYGRSLRG